MLDGDAESLVRAEEWKGVCKVPIIQPLSLVVEGDLRFVEDSIQVCDPPLL